MRLTYLLTFYIFIFLITMKITKAQDPFFEKKIFISGKDTLPYVYSVPPENLIKNIPDSGYPLIIFLHGSGERGNDNEKQLIHTKKQFCDTTFRTKYLCYIIAPQCPKDKRWVEVNWDADSHKMPENPSKPLNLLYQLIQETINKEKIDKSRIYITGLSMGGYGTWDAICRWPDLFAAAIPICGGGDESKAYLIRKIPIWNFHGVLDQAVKVSRSRNMIAAIIKAGGDPIYTEYAEGKHNVWLNAYESQQTWDWLFSRVKK